MYVEEVFYGKPGYLEISNERGFYDIEAKFTLGQISAVEFNQIAEQLRTAFYPISDREIGRVIAALKASMKDVELGVGNTQSSRGGESVPLDPNRNTAEIVLTSLDKMFVSVEINEIKREFSREIRLYLSAERGESTLDYTITNYTDSFLFEAQGEKGLYVNISAVNERGQIRAQLMKLGVNKLMKY